MTRYVSFALMILLFFLTSPVSFGEGISGDISDLMMGMPIGGGSEKANLDICPHGARVVAMFLAAWQKQDYRTMYDLIDDESKKDYPFEQAKFDFQFIEYKPYKISSVKQKGDNFEFLISYGDWKDGNKDMKKIIINGTTYKIIMPTKNSPFKESAANYF